MIGHGKTPLVNIRQFTGDTMTIRKRFSIYFLISLLFTTSAIAQDDAERLVAAMLGDTPLIDDLHELTDTIGGRVTGTDANREAIAWALKKLHQAEVSANGEDFEMPYQWQENIVVANVSGDVNFEASVVAKPFSTAANALQAPLVDGGLGSDADFERLGEAARGAWVMIETPILDDEIGLAGLFAEYGDAAAIEPRAFAAGVAGVIFMSSRPKNLTYRHNASAGGENKHPLLVMEREHAKRALRLIRSGHSLSVTATIGVESGYSYSATNVVAEIPGKSRPEEIVLFGSHIDSHDLGTGALDNGVNVVMLINIARQITRLGLQPERTIRLVLWNGEEQGLVGSMRYTEQHDDELDQHVVAASLDIGSGRTGGFFTGGRSGLIPMLDRYLVPVAGLGPFQHPDVPITGTDHFDFLIEGVPTLVGAQSDANYASNYHAESDTFDKVDQQQVRLNSAVTAAVIWGFANDTERLPRLTHDEIQNLIDSTDLGQQMKNFGTWQAWDDGTRGRH
jgi:Zn-dependent M28 family amino/carboxypeptidase